MLFIWNDLALEAICSYYCCLQEKPVRPRPHVITGAVATSSARDLSRSECERRTLAIQSFEGQLEAES